MYIDLSLFDRLKIVLKYFTSSFMSIELIVIVLCLFLFLFFNLKRKKKSVNIFVPVVVLLFLAFISMGFHEYAIAAINEVVKFLINYYYFPSMSFYFVIMLFTTIYLIYIVYSNKYSDRFKIFNYIFCFILYVSFVGLFSYIVSNNLSLSIDYAIYKDKYILSFVQLSNLIFWLWMLITFFIKIYNYFRKKFD
jgi:hypothetical protein